MSPTNTKIESLVARRALAVSGTAGNEALGIVGNDLRRDTERDQSAGTTACEALCAAFRGALDQAAESQGRAGGSPNETVSTTITRLRIACENVDAAEHAVRCADFALEASELTRSRILAASSIGSPRRAGARPEPLLALLRQPLP